MGPDFIAKSQIPMKKRARELLGLDKWGHYRHSDITDIITTEHNSLKPSWDGDVITDQIRSYQELMKK